MVLRPAHAAFVITSLLVGAAPAIAQQREYPDRSITTFRSVERPPVDSKSGTRMYLQVGRVWLPEENEGLATGELRWGSVAPLQPSADFTLAFGLVPALLTSADLDLALPIAVAPGVRLIPRGGVSGLTLLGGDAGGFAFGLNTGGGLVLDADGPLLLRVDYTARILAAMGEGPGVLLHQLSAGIGWRF